MFKDITKEKKLIEWNTMNRVLYFLPETPEKRPYFSRLTISTIKTAQSLDKYIKTSGQSLKIDELTEIILQMIESLQTLHSGNLSCGHINPKSFQVSIPDFNGKIKVIIEGKFEVKTIQNKAITSSMNTEYRCWISPEALQSLENGHNFEVTKENDVFSMGCVIYFVLTRGEHPFAFNEKNIMKNNFNLSGIKGDENQIYVDLIESMINNKKAERPSIEVVLKHPMFWKPEKVLQFYTDIKNLFHAENEKVMETPGFRNIQEEVKTKMKEESNAIFGGNWFNLLCDELKTYEDQKPNHRIKDKTSFVKLLDYIRDKNQHYDEWPQNIKNIFGSTNGSYLEYFKQRFPLLLITTYKIMKVMKAERKLDLYY
jgi:serine/threonine-protein kinase/endoribonuclease IRE1